MYSGDEGKLGQPPCKLIRVEDLQGMVDAPVQVALEREKSKVVRGLTGMTVSPALAARLSVMPSIAGTLSMVRACQQHP